jgi:hypothetical protein
VNARGHRGVGSGARGAPVMLGLIGLLTTTCGCSEVPPQGQATGDSAATAPESTAAAQAIPDSSFVGFWQAESLAAGHPGRRFMLELYGSGAATLTRHYADDRSPLVASGSWQPDEEGHAQVVLWTRNGASARPGTLAVALQGDSLRAILPDSATWGRSKLLLTKTPPGR